MVFAGTGVWKSRRGTTFLDCRCVFINDEHYGYNVRDELTSADEVSYNYDDIGNRTTAEGKTNTANNLNQYTAIDDFAPQYDADGIHAPTSMSEVGNQTLIKTSTGIWSVTYNAENRPVRWQSGDTEITMAFDSMGRRVSMRTLTPGFDLLQRFVYKDFLCVRQLRGPDATPYQSYVWDPTEPIATRPLLLRDAASIPFYYYHDGNKNVAGLTDASRVASLAYAYTPYGAPSLLPSSLPLDNPFQFSSEVYDAALGLSYYNYRHYLQTNGRFVSRDPLACLNLFQFHLIANEYVFTGNTPNNEWDFLGMIFEIEYTTPNGDYHSLSLEEGGGIDEIEKMFDVIEKEQGNICRVWCGGHGDGRTVIINGEWDGMSFWATDNEKTLRIKAKSGEGIILFEPSRTEPGLFRQENITDRLKKLGADDAEYVYNACLSAHGDENISRRTSQIFPKSTVKGNRGYSYLGIEEPHLYIRRTYQNGKRISLF